MKKLIAVVISVALVFSLGVFCVSANEENGYDNFLDSYLNAIVTLSEISESEITNWEDVLLAASDGLADVAGDEAESFALALDGLNAALSEFSNEEFESWDDAIVYGSEQLLTDTGMNANEMLDAFLGAGGAIGETVDSEAEGFAVAADGTVDALVDMVKVNFTDLFSSLKKIMTMISDYIAELSATFNWYAERA